MAMATPPTLPQASHKFERVGIGACHRQTATDRFGKEANSAIRDRERIALGMNHEGYEIPFTWPDDSFEDETPGQQNSIYKRVPCMAGYRNNLTAISQSFNLYFAAYQGHIFVYVPRSIPKQSLSDKPDLQLRPPPTKAAQLVGGTLDTRHAHIINHIITSFLGNEEILVACYDDGDVVAYYTREIADWIACWNNVPLVRPAAMRRAGVACPQKQPTFFLQSNVGISAWGLAVHKGSRLIAVSSNRSEITIFAPALAADDNTPSSKPSNTDNLEYDEGSPEDIVRCRSLNWRIVVVLGPQADNLPNIRFLDSDSGEADKICAIDINGSIWIASIWELGQPVRRILPSFRTLLTSEEFWPNTSRGWGLLPLRDDNFKVVETIEDMFGINPTKVLPPSRDCNQAMLDIYEGVRTIPDNPCPLRAAISTVSHDLRPVQNVLPPFFEMLLNIVPGSNSETENSNSDNPADADNNDDDDDETSSNDLSEDDDMDSEGQIEGPQNPMIQVEDLTDFNANFTPASLIMGLQDDVNDDLTSDEEIAEGAGAPIVEHTNESPEESDSDTSEQDSASHTDDFDEYLDEEMEIQNNIDFQNDMEDMEDEIDDDDIDDDGFDDGFNDSLLQNEFDHIGLLNAILTGDDDDIDTASTPSDMLSEAMAFINETDTAMEAGSNASTTQQNQSDVALEPLSSFEEGIYFPHSGRIEEAPKHIKSLIRWLLRKPEYNTIAATKSRGWDKLSKRYRILRTYEKDMELRTLQDTGASNNAEIGVLCQDALAFGAFREPALRPFFRASSRLNMVTYVPELSIVVLGSQIGRVLILTPTKLAKPEAAQEGFWHHGLRLEWVLPRESEETQPKASRRPLHGLAIGPIQEDHGVGGTYVERGPTPRRFRLMLHYRNHEILTYEIARDDETDRLCIF